VIAPPPPPSTGSGKEVPVMDSGKEAPTLETSQEVPAGPPQQTELFVNGQSAGTFAREDLTVELQTLFPDSVFSLTDVRVWDQPSWATDANPNIRLDQLLVWDNSAATEEKSPGRSQAAGKLGKAREFPRPRISAWRELMARRRLHATFVWKDSQS